MWVNLKKVRTILKRLPNRIEINLEKFNPGQNQLKTNIKGRNFGGEVELKKLRNSVQLIPNNLKISKKKIDRFVQKIISYFKIFYS